MQAGTAPTQPFVEFFAVNFHLLHQVDRFGAHETFRRFNRHHHGGRGSGARAGTGGLLTRIVVRLRAQCLGHGGKFASRHGLDGRRLPSGLAGTLCRLA